MAERAQLDFDSPGVLAAQLYGLFIGPLTFGFDLLLSYSLVPHACSTGHEYVLHVVTAVAFVIVASGLFTSVYLYQRIPGEMPKRGDELMSRARFVILLGILMCFFCEVLIIASSLPRFVLSPCDQ